MSSALSAGFDGSPSRRSKRIRSSSVDDVSEATVSPARTRSPDPKRSKQGVHLAATVENDPKKIQARLKQIGFGKNTVGYDNYTAAVPRHERRGYTEHPRTPDPYEVQSKRSFDGRIKAWRRELHKWDTLHPPPPVPVSVNPALSLIGPTGCNETLEQTLARQSHARYTETLAALSERPASTSEVESAEEVEARFEEYMNKGKAKLEQMEGTADELQEESLDDEDIL